MTHVVAELPRTNDSLLFSEHKPRSVINPDEAFFYLIQRLLHVLDSITCMNNQAGLPTCTHLSWSYVILTGIVLIYSVYAISLGAGLYGLHAIPAADSGSMRPVIDGCDIVVYSEDTELQEGDIGIFEPNWDWRQFHLLGHRVIDVHDDSYTFSGDAVEGTEHIEQTNVRGTVEYIIPTRHLCQ